LRPARLNIGGDRARQQGSRPLSHSPPSTASLRRRSVGPRAPGDDPLATNPELFSDDQMATSSSRTSRTDYELVLCFLSDVVGMDSRPRGYDGSRPYSYSCSGLCASCGFKQQPRHFDVRAGLRLSESARAIAAVSADLSHQVPGDLRTRWSTDKAADIVATGADNGWLAGDLGCLLNRAQAYAARRRGPVRHSPRCSRRHYRTRAADRRPQRRYDRTSVAALCHRTSPRMSRTYRNPRSPTATCRPARHGQAGFPAKRLQHRAAARFEALRENEGASRTTRPALDF